MSNKGVSLWGLISAQDRREAIIGFSGIPGAVVAIPPMKESIEGQLRVPFLLTIFLKKRSLFYLRLLLKSIS
jgi:hypothetical protein